LIQALLFDIDGVLIWHEKWFAITLSNEKYYKPLEIMDEYHRGVINVECDRGAKDPIEEVKPFLERIKWNYSPKDYLDMKYEFESQYIDYKMLEIIKSMKGKGIKTYIGSNQNYYRKKFLQNKMNLADIFDESFFSCDLGFVKPENGYWEGVLAKININNPQIRKEDILFIDDTIENVDSAKKYGMKVKHIKNRNDVLEVLKIVN
jgi:putative hydrolase of the HAD superfamily